VKIMKKVVIVTENLSKYYGKGKEIKALDELNIEVFEGETFGLWAPTEPGRRRPSDCSPG
jgi:ABC-type dipeptide/oligopeptide/nickel transport system ATPase subunit